MKQKILVTGGNGFIGSHLAKRLYREGNEVHVVDIKKNEYMHYPFCTKNTIADLRNPTTCLTVTKNMDRVYHLAADMGGIGFIKTVLADVMKNNTRIDINMMEACRTNNVPRIFYSSSACAYPVNLQEKNPDVMLKEEDIWPYDPEKAYGFEKLYAEQLCEAYRQDYGVEGRIARFHNIYGPEGTWKGGREKAPAALCRKVAEAKDGTSIEIWGDGAQVRSFCHVTDCIEAFIRLMESDIQEPLNIGTEDAVSITKLADMIIRISGKTLTKTYNTSKPIGVNYRNADITKIKKLLGWQPKVKLEDGLAETYKWIEAQVRSASLEK
jgi:GDP-D-mannose 3',5'-epimerase